MIMYNVDTTTKHAGQEGLGQVYQVLGAKSRPDHSAVEIGSKGQHHVQAGLLGRRLGKCKFYSDLGNSFGLTLLLGS